MRQNLTTLHFDSRGPGAYLYLKDRSCRSKKNFNILVNMLGMDTLIADFIFKMALASPVAILVGVSAGKLLPTLTARTLEGEITKCAVGVLKDQIVEKLTIVYTVYRGISPTGGGHSKIDDSWPLTYCFHSNATDA